MARLVNQPTLTLYTLKKIKKRIGTGDGGKFSTKGLKLMKLK